jgi:cation transport ATPase
MNMDQRNEHASAPNDESARPPEDGPVSCHPLANELVDSRKAAAAQRSDDSPRDRAVRSVSRVLLLIVLGLVILAFMIAAAAFENWFVLIITAIVAAVYMLVVGAPVWLAMATKGAQDADH